MFASPCNSTASTITSSLDMSMTSSVSSSSLLSRLPPRPDSPRLPMGDPNAAQQARLRQLGVWSDAAEDERENDQGDTLPPLPSMKRSERPADRETDTGLMRRQSFFCGARPRSRMSSGFTSFYNTRSSFYSREGNTLPCRTTSINGMERRSSFRRGKSFHRYNRVQGRVGEVVEPVNDEFDDLATKVTEMPVEAVTEVPVQGDL